jgi:hypothetical protein
VSADGVTWTQVVSKSLNISTNATAGLFECSHNASAIGTATFERFIREYWNILPPLVILNHFSTNSQSELYVTKIQLFTETYVLDLLSIETMKSTETFFLGAVWNVGEEYSSHTLEI